MQVYIMTYCCISLYAAGVSATAILSLELVLKGHALIRLALDLYTFFPKPKHNCLSVLNDNMSHVINCMKSP